MNSAYRPRPVCLMSESAAVSRSTQPDIDTLRWLALALTPAVGPTRGHRVVQHFGSVERVFHASLTEVEAAGLPRCLRAVDRARQVVFACRRAIHEGARCGCRDHRLHRSRGSKKSMIHPLFCSSAEIRNCFHKPGLGVVGTEHPTPYGNRNGRTAFKRSCDPRSRNCQRNGSWSGHGSSSRCAERQRRNSRDLGNRN